MKQIKTLGVTHDQSRVSGAKVRRPYNAFPLEGTSPMPKPKASYPTIELKIPPDLVDQIRGVTSTPGTWQRPFQRIATSMKKVGNDYVGRVRGEDLQKMKEWAQDPRDGSYERWAAEILELNGIDPES